MGELVVIGEDEQTPTVKEVREEEKEQKRELERVMLKENGSFKWENFLPVTGIRVLLVEADDSTRQIIAALLRKCNYKVVALSDGLEAWKVLKKRHSNIDLILTEVDLPSISGYALLSLIMEHHFCRHIPVVMMSSRDSINMVFKCMAIGAADFLTKPLRKNELKNLWQHVWRKLTVNGGSEPHGDLNNGRHKVEAIPGNEAANNPCSESSDNASANKKRQHNEKACEVQSAYTMHCLEAETAQTENLQRLSAQRPNETTHLSHKKTKQHHEKNVKSNDSARNGKPHVPTSIMSREGESCPARTSVVDGMAPEGCKNMDTGDDLLEPSRVAIDLIGRIDDQQKHSLKESSTDREMISEFTFGPQLELSLKGFHDKDKQGMEDRVKLKHSNASAFSRYGDKQLGSHLPSSSSICTEINGGECEISTEVAPCENTVSAGGGFRSKTTTVASQSTQTGGAAVPSSHQRLWPLAFSGVCVGYGAVLPSNYGSQVLPVTLTNPGLVLQKESSPVSASSSLQSSDPGTLSSTPGCCQYDQEATNLVSGPQPVHDHEALVSMEQHQSTNGQSSVTDHPPCGHTKYKTVSDGTMGSATPDTSVVQKAEGIDGYHVLKHDQVKGGGDPHRNALRKAALDKFKRKKKARCFDKKVRYQSRKKLAEQRPRVKGQFVRQA